MPGDGIAANRPENIRILGREEEPEAELARVVLLLERLEVVCEVLGMPVGSCGECGWGHVSS